MEAMRDTKPLERFLPEIVALGYRIGRVAQVLSFVEPIMSGSQVTWVIAKEDWKNSSTILDMGLIMCLS